MDQSEVDEETSIEAPKGFGDPTTDDSVSTTHEMLSARIRELRTEQGLSIATLARQAGITSAMASQVERGVTKPSIATVTRIATALGVSMSELFDVEPPRGMVIRYADRRKINYPDKDVVDDLISSDPTRQLQVLDTRIGPRQRTGGQLAPHGAAVEFVLVLGGELEIYIGTETYHLFDGDTVTFDGRLAHGFTNHTDHDVRLIWVTIPGTF